MTLGAAKEFKYIPNEVEIKENVEVFALAKLTTSSPTTTKYMFWLRRPSSERSNNVTGTRRPFLERPDISFDLDDPFG